MKERAYLTTEDFFLRNKLSETIKIPLGTRLIIQNEFEDRDAYKIDILPSDNDKWNKLPKVLMVDPAFKKKIKGSSKEMMLSVSNSHIFFDDPQDLKLKEISDLISKRILDFGLKLEANKNLSSNFEDIEKTIIFIQEKIKTLSKKEINFTFLNEEELEAVNFFNEDIKLKLKNKNNKNLDGNEVYLPGLERAALEWFSSAVSWAKEKDLNMVNLALDDFVDVLRISNFVNENQMEKTKAAFDFDTIVRDSLPQDFWNKITEVNKELKKKKALF